MKAISLPFESIERLVASRSGELVCAISSTIDLMRRFTRGGEIAR
jgi:hypothetical protein